MLIDALRLLYGYQGWANERIFATAERVTREQFMAPQTMGRGPMRDTMVHLINGQRGWLAFWDGSLPPGQYRPTPLEPTDFPDVASIRREWAGIDRRTHLFIAKLRDADLTRVYTRPNADGSAFASPLYVMMLHMANHGTQHRSEVAAMLTAFGQSPGDIDFMRYAPQALARQ